MNEVYDNLLKLVYVHHIKPYFLQGGIKILFIPLTQLV